MDGVGLCHGPCIDTSVAIKALIEELFDSTKVHQYAFSANAPCTWDLDCSMQTFILQDGRSPLYASSSRGDLEIVKTLIEAGANINQANKVSTHICIVLVIHLHIPTHV